MLRVPLRHHAPVRAIQIYPLAVEALSDTIFEAVSDTIIEAVSDTKTLV